MTGHLENIFVPDLNNPDVSLNAFQVLNIFHIITVSDFKHQALKTGDKQLDGGLWSVCDGG